MHFTIIFRVFGRILHTEYCLHQVPLYRCIATSFCFRFSSSTKNILTNNKNNTADDEHYVPNAQRSKNLLFNTFSFGLCDAAFRRLDSCVAVKDKYFILIHSHTHTHKHNCREKNEGPINFFINYLSFSGCLHLFFSEIGGVEIQSKPITAWDLSYVVIKHPFYVIWTTHLNTMIGTNGAA